MMRIVGAATTLIVLLAGCSGRAPPPAIAYDDPQPALPEMEAPKPVEIVRIPEPLPLPGQLLPLPPDRKTLIQPANPLARVDQANRAARIEPAQAGYINAIQVWPYTSGALYQVYTAPGRITDIALQEGEELVEQGAVAAGDTARWVIGDTESGDGATRRVHILVKPIRADLPVNSLVINTKRRTYHLELRATESTSMASVSWDYPHDRLFALEARNRQAAAVQPVATGVDLARLNFRYEITGDQPPWRPLRAFDDGAKVYIEFPRGIGQGEMPPLFVIGASGDSQLVNYRIRGNHYIVDRLFVAAELRLGAEPQQVVRISRSEARPGA
jgi:type IV secretion system protein TrbG